MTGIVRRRRDLLGLLRKRDFRLLWIGETTSTLGTAVTRVALPLVAISELHANTFAVAALSAAAWAPWLVLGMPAGAIIDRRRRKPVMLWCDAASILLFASIPIAHWTGLLSLAQLFAVAGGAGVAAVFFTTAYTAYLPHILEPDERDEGNAKIFGSAAAANLVGPGLAGLVARIVGAATALLADAISFVVSMVCLWRIRTPEPAPTTYVSSTLRREIVDGVRFTATDSYLRTLTIWGGLANLSFTATQSLLVLFLIRTVEVDAATAGLVLAATGVGGIVGAAASTAVCRRVGTGYGLLLCELATAPFGLLIPLTHSGFGLAFVIVGTVVPAAGVAAGNVIQQSFTQNYCPPHMLGRLSATRNVFNYGTMPIGAVLAGSLGASIGVRPTLWITTAILIVAGTLLIVSPIRRGRNLPDNSRVDRSVNINAMPLKSADMSTVTNL